MKNLKYEYHLKTWGGFYNNEYYKIHGLKGGDFWFDTLEARQEYIDKLKLIEIDLHAVRLMIKLTEGYCCRIRTKLHRVIQFDGKQYYSKYDIGVNYPFNAAQYHLQYKWYPGFNDYPLGENFDYNNVEIIKEWITGAFSELEFNN